MSQPDKYHFRRGLLLLYCCIIMSANPTAVSCGLTCLTTPAGRRVRTLLHITAAAAQVLDTRTTLRYRYHDDTYHHLVSYL